MAPARVLNLDLVLDPHAPRKAREALEQLRGGLDYGVFELLRLIVSELVTHAVTRGGHELALEVRTEGGDVRGSVRAPNGSLTWHSIANPEVTGDWGAYLVNRLADRWGRQSTNGNELWFEIVDDTI